MSLSALNYPPLVAAATAGTAAAFPFLQNVASSAPFTTLKWANFIAYWVNFGSVSQPGRLDGRSQSAMENAKSEEVERLARQGRSLVNPSGWAFIIWAPIFMGELAMVTSQLLFEKEAGVMGPVIKSATAPFVAANIFQVLWCASFRPKYGTGAWMSVSFANLASTAYSLAQVHTATLGLTGWRYLLYGLPTSLHFGWITAASLVNLNGAVAMSAPSAKAVAWLGHVSVVAATALGVFITWDRKAPVYGGVIAWALTAVADGLTKRISRKENESSSKEVGLLGAKLQLRLSQTGAILSAGTSVAVLAIMASSSDKGSRGSKVAP